MSRPLHIVYLHGLGSSPVSFNYILSQAIPHVHHPVSYDTNQAVEESYLEVIGKINALNIKRFAIIGHSLGGIIAKLVAVRHPEMISHLISISTPYGGSRAATALQLISPSMKVLRDITPFSSIITELAAAKVPNFTSIISTGGHIPFLMEENDGVVSVSSQRATNAEFAIERAVNHFEVLLDEVTVATINHTLER